MKSMGRRVAWATAAAAVRIAVAAAPAAAEGENPQPPGAEGENPQPLGAPELGQVIANARLWVLAVLASVATLYLVIGGARYVLAGGDPGEVERAKTTIGSALKGYALAVLAPIVMTILRGIVGG